MVVDSFQFTFLALMAGSVGACISAWYTRRKTLAECEERIAEREARISVAFDAAQVSVAMQRIDSRARMRLSKGGRRGE